MQAAYMADVFFRPVFLQLSATDSPPSSFASRQYSLRGGLLYTSPDSEGVEDRLCVPADRDLRALLMHTAHSADVAGHPGVNRTLDVARLHYFWPGLAKDVTTFVNSCPVCQRVKADTSSPAGLLHPLEPALCRWGSISIDFAVSLPLSMGFRAVLLVVDRFSRRLRLLPVPSMEIDAASTAQLLLQHIVPVHGLPEDIVSDRDPRFTSSVWSALWKSLGVRLRMSTAAHPETDGSSERAFAQ